MARKLVQLCQRRVEDAFTALGRKLDAFVIAPEREAPKLVSGQERIGGKDECSFAGATVLGVGEKDVSFEGEEPDVGTVLAQLPGQKQGIAGIGGENTDVPNPLDRDR